MSGKVTGQVLEHSRAEHGARLVAVVLADAAHPDGVAWLGQAEIARLARLSERAVRDGLEQLVALDEVEVRTAQRGRRRVNVYRVIVGSVAERDVDYDDLPFDMKHPFSRPADIAARRLGDDQQHLPVVGDGRPAESDTDDRQNSSRYKGTRQENPSLDQRADLARSLAERKNDLEERVAAVFQAVEGALGMKAPTIGVHRREFARLVRLLVVEVGATPDEVTRRARAYRAHQTFGGVMLTLPALVKWWHAFDEGDAGQAATAYAATEAYLRNLAHVLDDRDVVDELRDRVERALITRDQAVELLAFARELRHEHEARNGAAALEADPVEDFDVRLAIVKSLRGQEAA